MSSPRHVLQFRGRVVLSASESISCWGWRVAGGLVWPGPRLVTDQQSVTLLLAAAAWLPGQRWSPNWFRTTFILHINLWAARTQYK